MRAVPYVVCIASRGRGGELERMFREAPELNHATTCVGLEREQMPLYAEWRKQNPKPTVVWVEHNPHHWAGVAREYVRKTATRLFASNHYVLIDDDCRFATGTVGRLVSAHHEYSVAISGPCFMSAMHQTYGLWDRELVRSATRTPSGWRVYERMSYLFWSIPGVFYESFSYPTNVGYLDDVQLALHGAMSGIPEFRVCADATFATNRDDHQPGGFESVANRVAAIGYSVTQIATDFPELVDRSTVTVRLPWKEIIRQQRQSKQLKGRD